jgi:hypothetical protein
MSLFTKGLYGTFLLLVLAGMAFGVTGPSVLLLFVGYAFFRNAQISGRVPSATILKS